MIETSGITIANNIRAERNRANIKMEEINSKLGISRATYIEYEKDASKVKVETLLKLAELFKCPIDSFFIK